MNYLLRTIGLAPVIVPQGIWTNLRVPTLPEPPGAREGFAGKGRPLKLLVVGDSAAAGVGVSHQDEALLGQVVSRLSGRYRVEFGLHAKTGYTSAAGFNLVASARRGNERVITTVFGGVSSAARNAQVSELMDMGFRRAPSSVRLSRPKRPSYGGGTPGKSIQMVGAVKQSPFPTARPGSGPELPQAMLVAMASDIQSALAEVQPDTQAAF